MLKKIFQKILDILFPVECLACGRNDFLLCEACFNSIVINKNNFFKTEHIDQIHVCASFHQKLLQKLIYFYKYNYIEELSNHLSEIMIKYYLQINKKIVNPVVIPVPLHQKRVLERCFNQSELIAQEFCQKFNYEYQNNLIVRIKNTKHQVGLDKKERIENMTNAFRIKDCTKVKNRNFIIIDDLYTTGATASGMAKLLKDNGAYQVWCLVIAKN